MISVLSALKIIYVTLLNNWEVSSNRMIPVLGYAARRPKDLLHDILLKEESLAIMML